DYVRLDYKYTTPNSDWITYNSFAGTPIINISFNILNLRDDNITFRLVGFDDLGNSKELYNSDFWFIKDFNNHLDFVISEPNTETLYELDFEDMIDIGIEVYPVDNDISKVVVETIYESFELTSPISEDDHIYFSDNGDNKRLNATFYDIIGEEFSSIPITIKLYQDAALITSKQIIITVTDTIFDDTVNISNIDISISNGFHETFDNEYWDLYNVSNRFIEMEKDLNYLF
ncbi:unnamed protein product, partial [marine sediment metagenome]